MINILKLHQELRAAGLPIVGVAEDGRIDWASQPTESQQIEAQVIIGEHDPYDYSADVQAGAEAQARAIPNWAHWSEDKVLDWIETNIQKPLDEATTFAQAKAVMQTMVVVMRAQSRMLVAERNKLWPNLQRDDDG